MNSFFYRTSFLLRGSTASKEGSADGQGDSRKRRRKVKKREVLQRSRRSETLQAHLDGYRLFKRRADDLDDSDQGVDGLSYVCYRSDDNKSLDKKTYYTDSSGESDDTGSGISENENFLDYYIEAYAEFILFLQYLGVILGDERVDLGIWETVVGWLAFILGELDFSDMTITFPAISLIVAIAAFPLVNIVLLIYFTKAKYRILVGYVPLKDRAVLYDDHYAKQSALRNDFRIMYFVGFTFFGLLVSSIVLLLKENAVGFFVIIASGYVFIFLVFLIGREVVFSTISIRLFLRSLLVFSYVPLDSFLATNIVIFSVPESKEEEVFGIVGVIVMTILMIYLVFFEIQYILFPSTFAISVKAHDKLIQEAVLTIDQVNQKIREEKEKTYSGKLQIRLSTLPIFYNEKQQLFLERENRSNIDPQKYYIGIVYFFERLLISLCGGVFGSEDFQDRSALLSGLSVKQRENVQYFGFAIILILTCLSLYIVKPYAYMASDEQHKLVAMRFIPRVAHILLLVVIIVRENLAELVLQLVLFCAISLPSLYFWYHVLEPQKVYILLEEKLDYIHDSIEDGYIKLTWDNLMKEGTSIDDYEVTWAINKTGLSYKIWKPLPLGLKLRVIYLLSQDNFWGDLYKQNKLDNSLYKKANVDILEDEEYEVPSLEFNDSVYDTSLAAKAPPIAFQHFGNDVALRFNKVKLNTDNSTHVYEQLSQQKYWEHWKAVPSLVIEDSLNPNNANAFHEFLLELNRRNIGEGIHMLDLSFMQLTVDHYIYLLSFIESTPLKVVQLKDWRIYENCVAAIEVLWEILLRVLSNKNLPRVFSSTKEEDIQFSFENDDESVEHRNLSMTNMIIGSGENFDTFIKKLSKVDLTSFFLSVHESSFVEDIDSIVKDVLLCLLEKKKFSCFDIKFSVNDISMVASVKNSTLSVENMDFLADITFKTKKNKNQTFKQKIESLGLNLIGIPGISKQQ